MELGLNHAKRLNLRARLKAVRMTCPLFDTAQWVRDLEKVRLWELADLQDAGVQRQAWQFVQAAGLLTAVDL